MATLSETLNWTYREKLKTKILARNQALFEKMEVVKEYERFFLKAMKSADGVEKKHV